MGREVARVVCVGIPSVHVLVLPTVIQVYNIQKKLIAQEHSLLFKYITYYPIYSRLYKYVRYHPSMYHIVQVYNHLYKYIAYYTTCSWSGVGLLLDFGNS